MASPRDAVRRDARGVLERNWREGRTRQGDAFAYTAPDARKFPAQFYWDSCFHAVAWAALGRPDRARAELRTLLAAQEDDGFIGHTVFWDRGVRLSRRPFYNLRSARDRMTRTIQPPLLAWAWDAVAAASDDEPGFRGEALARLARHYDWLERHRDPDRTGLIAIIQPDESGLDASPKFDERLRWRAHGLPGFVCLVRRNRRDGFDLRRIRARGGFATAEVLTNVAYAMSLEALGRLGGGSRYTALAEHVRRALVERCWDERRGRFVDDPAGGGERVSTWASLAPLALGRLPPDHARRLVEEHVLDVRRYWRRYPVPSTSLQEAAYRPRTRYPLRYWRGPTWVASSWLIHRGLRLHGYDAEAEELAARLRRLVAAAGFREYYHPDAGTGQGARAFGMSTLAAVT